jgi:hypothetical protein
MEPEHIEPVRSLPLERRSRARTFAVALLPAFVLIVVIGFATFGGGRFSDTTTADTDRNGEVERSAEPQPVPSDAPDVADLRSAGFPTRALGLPVHSVARTLELHDDGEIKADVVAVAGWLSVPPDPACGVDRVDDRGGLYGTGTACTRATILAGDAEPVVAVRSGGLRDLRTPGIAIRPVGLPGPSLAGIAARQVAPDNVVLPERAIVLGRFADPRLEDCQASSPECVSAFAIERVVWVDGSWRLRRPLIYPSEDEPEPSGQVRWPIVDRAIRRGAIILSETIVARADLAAVDPDADAATPVDAGTVWYVRALLRPRGIEDSSGEVGWAVIDDDTAVVLASDPERTVETSARETPSTRASPTPQDEVDFPDRMFGVEVLTVDVARQAGADGLGADRLVVVEGWLTVAPDTPGCTELPVVACPRQGTLSATRELGGQLIAVETPPGTPLLGLTRQNPSLGTWTVPNRVALVGRLREQQTACGDASCDLVLTIERLAWLRTAARDRPVVTAPGSLETRWTREAAEEAARHAVRGAGATLLLALVDRPTLRLVDEAAWEAIGGAAGTSPVWYLRAIARPEGAIGLGAAVVGWSVVDDRTHAVLASGLSEGAR